MGRFSNEVYKDPSRYHCGCGYACKKHVVYPLILEHLINGHGIHLCESMMEGNNYVVCAGGDGCAGSHRMPTRQEIFDHAREKHGVQIFCED
jgi:hypothetical protein